MLYVVHGGVGPGVLRYRYQRPRYLGEKKSPDFSGLVLVVGGKKLFVYVASGVLFRLEVLFLPVRKRHGVALTFEIEVHFPRQQVVIICCRGFGELNVFIHGINFHTV